MSFIVLGAREIGLTDGLEKTGSERGEVVTQPAAGATVGRGKAERALLLWAAVAFAFWPVLLDLGQHMHSRGWPRYSLLFVVLFAFAARAEGFVGSHGRDGHALLALSLLVEFALVQGGFTRVARVALPVAILGSCRAFGLASPRTALLSIWFVPVPTVLSRWFAGHGALALLTTVGVALTSRVAPVRALGQTLGGKGGSLTLSHADAGLPLIVLLSGLAWYTASRDELSWRSTLLRVSLWAGLGLPVAMLLMLSASLSVALGHPGTAELVLRGGPAVAAAALLWSSRRRRLASTRN